ncbi:antibiotic biosynthesis monooxygenase family protein [Gemmatimonadota bacterium]
MVLYVHKFDVHAGMGKAYAEWVQQVMPQILSGPGLVEFRAYRPQAGNSQIAVTYEFADMASWAAWQSDETMQRLFQESREFITNVTAEVWGPSPVVPEAIRPGS